MTTLQSPPSSTVTATPAQVAGWTLIATNPTGGQAPVGVVVSAQNHQISQAEFAAAHYGLGARYPVIISDIIGGQDGQLTVTTYDPTTYRILSGLLTSQATLWLADPFGDGWYVRAGFAGGSSASLTSPSTSPAAVRTVQVPADSGSSGVRTFTIVYVEQPQP